LLYRLILGFFLLTANLLYPQNQDSWLRKYQGSDQGKPCFLWVHYENGIGPNYEVEVSTSYEHQGQGIGKVILRFSSSASSKFLEWKNSETGEFMRVLLANPESSLSSPTAFRLKWLHFDHLHDTTCSSLQQADLP